MEAMDAMDAMDIIRTLNALQTPWAPWILYMYAVDPLNAMDCGCYVILDAVEFGLSARKARTQICRLLASDNAVPLSVPVVALPQQSQWFHER